MSIHFACKCGKQFKVADERIGSKVLCSGCGKTLKVPAKSQKVDPQSIPEHSGRRYDYFAGLRFFMTKTALTIIGLIVLLGMIYYLSASSSGLK